MDTFKIILGIMLLAVFLTYSLLSNTKINYFIFFPQLNQSASEEVNHTHFLFHSLLKVNTNNSYQVIDIPSDFANRQPDHVVKAYKLFFSRANNAKRISVKENCPVRGFMTISPKGRLGNLISQYATLYANARIDGVIPVIQPKMKTVLNQYFRSISLVTFEELGFGCSINITKVTLNDYRLNRASRIEKETCWYIDCCPNNAQVYHQYREDILEQFQFKQSYVDKANSRLQSIMKNQQNVTLIGVHIRRGDYPRYLRRNKIVEVGVEYLKNAMGLCRSQFGNVAFLVVSDTMEWARTNLQNEPSIYYVGEGRIGKPATDMATMSLCNHTIITQGTYSFWSGYLNKGQTIAPNVSISEIGFTLIPYI